MHFVSTELNFEMPHTQVYTNTLFQHHQQNKQESQASKLFEIRPLYMEQVSAEWYRGRTRSGCEGIFPVNYIDVKVPLDEAAPAMAASSQQQTSKPLRVRCLYNFPAECDGDLALKVSNRRGVISRYRRCIRRKTRDCFDGEKGRLK